MPSIRNLTETEKEPVTTFLLLSFFFVSLVGGWVSPFLFCTFWVAILAPLRNIILFLLVKNVPKHAFYIIFIFSIFRNRNNFISITKLTLYLAYIMCNPLNFKHHHIERNLENTSFCAVSWPTSMSLNSSFSFSLCFLISYVENILWWFFRMTNFEISFFLLFSLGTCETR